MVIQDQTPTHAWLLGRVEIRHGIREERVGHRRHGWQPAASDASEERRALKMGVLENDADHCFSECLFFDASECLITVLLVQNV